MVGVTFKSDNTVNAANKFGFQIDDNGSIRFEARMNGGIANIKVMTITIQMKDSKKI